MTTTGDKKTYQEFDLSINADRGICPEIRCHVRKKFKEDEGLSDLTNLFREHDWGGEAFSGRVPERKKKAANICETNSQSKESQKDESMRTPICVQTPWIIQNCLLLQWFIICSILGK